MVDRPVRGLLEVGESMEKRSRLVVVGLAIVIAAFLYLVYVAGSTLRGPADRSLHSEAGSAAVDPR